MSAPAHDPDRCFCLDCLLNKVAAMGALLPDAILAARSGDPDAVRDLRDLCEAIGEFGDEPSILFKEDGSLRRPEPVPFGGTQPGLFLRWGPRACP